MIRERGSDLPMPFRWVIFAIKDVGAPIALCIWLLYQQSTIGKETIKAIQEFKDVMITVQETLKEQNKILKGTN